MSTARQYFDPFVSVARLGDLARALNSHPTLPKEHVSARVWTPTVDIYEDNDGITIRADLPGMSQGEIDIEMLGDTLTIRGERKFADEEHRDKYIRVERQYGAFQRSFTIGVPIEPDKVTASYRNGILELYVPRVEATKPKKVKVSAE